MATNQEPTTTAELKPDAIAQLAAELVRYHNVVDADMAWSARLTDEELTVALLGKADVLQAGVVLARADYRYSLLANIEAWRTDKTGLPPHLVAGIQLAAMIRRDAGLVVDQVPDLAAVWAPEFEELASQACRLAQNYEQDGHDGSLARAFGVAQQAARMAERMTARVEVSPTADARVPAGMARPAAAEPVIIKAVVAEQRYHVTAETIGEAVRAGKLTDHRPAEHAKNAPHRVDEHEVAAIWPSRVAPK